MPLAWAQPDNQATGTAQMADLRQALGRLRHARSLAQLLDKATVELCGSCGFDRAVVFSIQGSRVLAESAHFDGDPDGAEHFLRSARSEPPSLRHPLMEAQMIRRRVPVLVTETNGDPRISKPLASVLAPESFVAAPIMPEGRVIGIVYADAGSSGRQVGEVDRETLWAFAEGLGYALERTVLLERLRSQRDRVNDLMGTATAAMDELSDATVELIHSGERPGSAEPGAGALASAPEPAIEQLLTKRELEVLSLMAVGIRNAGIARELVISEYTVKSHVKHILRKLGAVNRAEAVSRYLLTMRSTRRRPGGRRSDDAPRDRAASSWLDDGLAPADARPTRR